MKCNHCGAEIPNDSNFCEFCGNKVVHAADNKKGAGFWFGALLSCLIPLAGFILFGVKRKKQSSHAKVCLWCAVVNIVVCVLLSILLLVVGKDHRSNQDEGDNQTYGYVDYSDNPTSGTDKGYDQGTAQKERTETKTTPSTSSSEESSNTTVTNNTSDFAPGTDKVAIETRETPTTPPPAPATATATATATLEAPVRFVETMPEFPGGEAALRQYLSNHLRYPDAARNAGVQGVVMVEFIVEKDGSVSNAKVLNSVFPALDEEALRVVRSMPRWKPGESNGRKVRVYYIFPIRFILQ